ncbi:uncharacterized protein LOC117608266 isoform X1 [Osmia lignaria lignaria]|uniref:uncharacterized protein LOC117608266 isoform X1 n=2 Tax=Osmia lignaria lignaria TaxID=1437193 RepID=UPI00402BE3C7
MKQLNGCELDDSLKKQKGRTKKHKISMKMFTKTCWPKVMISRNKFICKKSKDAAEGTSLSYHEESSEKLSAKEEDLCCEENGENFEEEQGVCLISSSSEIPCESLQKLNESNEECRLVCATEETSGCRERPIFVDLTTDERSTWKQTIFKRFDEELESTENEKINGKQNHSANVVLEPRIMIADSSSKSNINGGGSLATALRDRGPCLIPVQPNRSLPIRPAPCVPARSLRKDCSPPLLVLSKSSSTDVVEVEPVRSINVSSNEEAGRREFDVKQERSMLKELANLVDCVVPRVSNVGSLSGKKKKIGEEISRGENRRKKKSQEADSTQREERVEGSIKEFLTNFCGSNVNEEAGNSCTDRCFRVVSSSKEEGAKVVPPLRLKKVIRTEMEGYTCRNDTGSGHESNYRIVTGTTPKPSSSPIPSSWNDMLCEKDTNFSPLNTDSYKLEYRRKKLKQKLRELRGKAVELAKQMASDSSSQQSTRLRQVMNRYEKQIENLSKLHSKLSASLPVLSEVIDVNENAANPDDDNDDDDDDEYLLMNFTETNEESTKNNSPASSPEPPKLSPRSPTNYENTLPEEARNSPPILPRVSFIVSSSQEPVEEELQISDRKLWSTEESLRNVNKISSDFEECVRTSPLNQQCSIDDVNKQPSSNPKKFLEDGGVCQEKKDEKGKLAENFPRNSPAVQETEKLKCLGFSKAEPMISTVISDMETTTDIQENEMLDLKPARQLSLQPNSFESAPEEDVSFPKSTQSVSKVAFNLNQWNQFNATRAASNQEHLTPQQNYKGEEIASSENHLMTEQFPSLGNWLTRMSKKQASKSKSKLQPTGNISFTPTENSTSISGAEIQKMVAPNTANESVNTSQYGTERWQHYHQQQQRQQQLLQHVAASVSLSQPTPAIPPLRSALCPPIPMSQFYPNNYAIDPYNSATLSYHSAICPYGTYPYHSRLHSAPLPGYHFPMQESLRPLLHLDKRLPSVQDSMARYPSPSTTLQHPINIDFDRIRGSGNVGNNVATATCLPSLFTSPSSLSSSHQTRTPLGGYPTNSQFTRNRMIPDVVAAAAAAAVVAAASIDRQRDTLTYNRNDIGIDGDAANPSKTNRTRDENFAEETRDNTAKYQQMQNFLYDRLTLVKTADNFAQTNSLIDNNTQAAMASIVSTPYQVPLSSTQPPLSKSLPANDLRNCDTPHLGKVSRSPNSLHNLVCSNCSSIGPKFKCLGCEMAFYCNERCQEKHWYVHVQKCPKKMPKLKKVT